MVKWYHRGLWILFSWFESMRGSSFSLRNLRRRSNFPSEVRSEAADAIFDYIETFYNRERLHSAPDY